MKLRLLTLLFATFFLSNFAEATRTHFTIFRVTGLPPEIDAHTGLIRSHALGGQCISQEKIEIHNIKYAPAKAFGSSGQLLFKGASLPGLRSPAGTAERLGFEPMLEIKRLLDSHIVVDFVIFINRPDRAYMTINGRIYSIQQLADWRHAHPEDVQLQRLPPALGEMPAPALVDRKPAMGAPSVRDRLLGITPGGAPRSEWLQELHAEAKKEAQEAADADDDW